MQSLKKWIFIILGSLIGLGIIYIAFSFIFVDLLVDYWWFTSLNLKGYFFLRIFYRYVIFVSVSFSLFLLFFINFWIASRHIRNYRVPEYKATKVEKQSHRYILEFFEKGSFKIYFILSLIMAIPLSAHFFIKWEEFLLYLFAPNYGLTESTHGKDISFYLFSYPIYKHIQNTLSILFLILFVGILLLYYIGNRLLTKEEITFSKSSKFHLTILFIINCLMFIWRHFIMLYDIQYITTHEPVFSGPGFIEMNFNIPLIWLAILLFTAASITLVVYIHVRKRLKTTIALLCVFFIAHAFRISSFVPDFLGTYFIKPNEIIREKPYIVDSIDSTLDAYALDKVVIRQYIIKNNPEAISSPEIKKRIYNIPVWDREFLVDVYTQVQGLRSFYSFPTVDVDRYNVDGRGYQQVYLGAREFHFDGLPEAAKNWLNKSFQYTHGSGVVMTPAAQSGDEQMTWYIKDIPPTSDFGFKIDQTAIYFGLQDSGYIIVPNDLGEVDHSKVQDILIHYDGKGGIPISSMFKKTLFSFYFHDNNILFTTKIKEDSKIIFIRNIKKRIKKITPFLLLDEDPYLVVTNKGLFWIQDAYTCSDLYPNSENYPDFKKKYEKKFNYIRNSVKIVVDAYNGTVDYYVFDSKDPIINAYRRIYPGLFKKIDTMPEELRTHLRYPKSLFEVQMAIYAKYHQTDPEIFYRQEDLWEFPKSLPMTSYYLTLDLFEIGRDEFLLICPMSPVKRENLRSLIIVGCDGEDYGKIIVYAFPKGQQIYGPSQISALIDQDTDIAQELSLWNQSGSIVQRGRIMVLPINNLILYIQPVYLRSTKTLNIPELKRIIVSQGEIVAMDKTIEEALKKLQEKLKNKAQRIQNRAQ
ncbi:MAG: UPF0182 family protein [Desulfobacterales bacterium]|nr:UPF0182 family protein [Desulfobacterales bacterium]